MVFELNNLKVIEENFYGSKIYYIQDFYRYPDKVFNFIFQHKLNYWKINDKPSYNSILFHDKRHDIICDEFVEVSNYLSHICGQETEFKNRIFTNTMRFEKNKFNDYEKNYWRPHLDMGYNALIYFNKFDCDGTNIYSPINDVDSTKYPEHFKPWVNRKKWNLLKILKSSYNKLVMFDGKKYYHGMSINDESFFHKDSLRVNQILFFREKL